MSTMSASCGFSESFARVEGKEAARTLASVLSEPIAPNQVDRNDRRGEMALAGALRRACPGPIRQKSYTPGRQHPPWKRQFVLPLGGSSSCQLIVFDTGQESTVPSKWRGPSCARRPVRAARAGRHSGASVETTLKRPKFLPTLVGSTGVTSVGRTEADRTNEVHNLGRCNQSAVRLAPKSVRSIKFGLRCLAKIRQILMMYLRACNSERRIRLAKAYNRWPARKRNRRRPARVASPVTRGPSFDALQHGRGEVTRAGRKS